MRRMLTVQYLRVSSEPQAKKYGPASQRQDIADAVERLHLQDPVVTYEDHISATGEVTRTDFERMLADAKAGRAELLTVGRVDRFARNERDGWNYLHDLTEAGAVVYFADEDCAAGLDEDWQEVVSAKLVASANWSRTISKNVKKAYRQRRKDNEYIGARPCWGYRKTADKKGVEFDPDQIDGLRLAVARILENTKIVAEICDELADAGYRNHGKRITKRRLTEILRNPMLKGSYQIWIGTPEYQELPDRCPRVVEDHVFRRIGEIMDLRSGRQRGRRRSMKRKFTYVLGEPLHCGHCGVPLYGGTSRHTKAGVKSLYYHHPDRGCGERADAQRPSFRERELLEILGVFFDQLQLPDDALATAQAYLDEETTRSGPDLKVERERLTNELTRIDRSFRRGGYGSDPDAAEQEWLAERAVLVAKIAALPDPVEPLTPTEAKVVLTLGEVWKGAADDDRRQLIEMLFERIDVVREGTSGSRSTTQSRTRITQLVPRARFQALLAVAICSAMCGSGNRTAHVPTLAGWAEFDVWKRARPAGVAALMATPASDTRRDLVQRSPRVMSLVYGRRSHPASEDHGRARPRAGGGARLDPACRVASGSGAREERSRP